ncbi:hypothetical protein [Planktotalea sp.]|uniref:hypothetical protein n=1 Tax=Planktotalea sp. TaxID=2029877 RepID=UPI00344C5E7A
MGLGDVPERRLAERQNAKMGLYCELYRLDSGETVNFDPEFTTKDLRGNALRLWLRNLNNSLHFDIGDAGISPTEFQADTFPQPQRCAFANIKH